MTEKKTVARACEHCDAPFTARKSAVARGHARFCSRVCAGRKVNAKYLLIGARGETNPNWRGGITKSSRGYWYVQDPDHPRANKEGYVKRANLVIEAQVGRYLCIGEVVHHVDHDRSNDALENLQLMSTASHRELHAAEVRRLTTIRRHRYSDAPSRRRYTWPADEDLIVLHRGASTREIAATIGCSHRAVASRLLIARKRLQSSSTCVVLEDAPKNESVVEVSNGRK